MNEIPQTRQSLLLALGRHSESAWSEFVSVYETALLRYCRARGLQEADAQDVLQNVLEAVYQRVPSWDVHRTGSFRGWIFRVARNIAVDAIEARAKKSHASGDSRVANLLNQIPSRDHNDSTFDDEYRQSLFDWASNQVRQEVQDVTWKSFCMTAIEGQKAEHVAQELGVPTGSVYTSKCRVLARIKAKIAELQDDTDSV
ncbi:MAG: sigma-70 family RNA polymerase sigma factor [Planctomycetota bacterium]